LELGQVTEQQCALVGLVGVSPRHRNGRAGQRIEAGVVHRRGEGQGAGIIVLHLLRLQTRGF